MKIGVMLRSIDEKQGIGVYTQNIMDHLLRLDTENEYVLFYRSQQFLGRYADYDHVREKLVTAPNKLIWDQVKIPLEARRERLDLIFHTKFTVPLFTGSKTVMVLHGSEWFVYPKAYKFLDRTYVRAMMHRYCDKATSIISNSEMTKGDFVNLLGVSPDKIKTTLFGYDSRFGPIDDSALLERVRDRYHLPNEFILFVGRIYPGKNFGNLIQAFSEIHTRIPHKIVVAGHPRYDYEGDLAKVETLGLQDKVLFTGWVPQEDLVAFYNLADVFVLPSFYEGFGIPVVEAMACGCPVVASQAGALPEVAGGAALLVDPNNPGEIATAIISSLTDERLKRQLVRQGLQRAKAFSWEKCARQTLEVLEYVGNSKSDRELQSIA